MVARAIQWLNKRPRGPFFLRVHLYDAHDPYDPPPPYSTRYARSLYDGEIAYADACVGKLIAALREAGLYDGALMAVMADHGEALGQHGEQTHGVFLYDETIHVPLLFKMPASGFGGDRVETRASLADVTPTILEVAGIPIPAAVQGKSLRRMIEHRPQAAPKTDTEEPPLPPDFLCIRKPIIPTGRSVGAHCVPCAPGSIYSFRLRAKSFTIRAMTRKPRTIWRLCHQR